MRRASAYRVWLVVWLAVLTAATAWAGADGHGASLWPDAGDPLDPIWGWRPASEHLGSAASSATLEYGNAPVVQQIDVGNTITDKVLLGDYVSLDLAGKVGLGQRVAVGVSLPVFLEAASASGVGPPALGDVILTAPIGLVTPAANGQGLGIGFAPVLRLPTGRTSRYLGDGEPGAGGQLAVGYRAGPWEVDGSLGADWRSLLDPTGAHTRGVQGTAHLALSRAFVDGVAVHLEARGAYPALTTGPPLVEALLGARGAFLHGWWWTAAVGRGLTAAAGASALRGYIGFGRVLASRGAPRVGPVPVRITVEDSRGQPVAGARAREADQVLGTTDEQGRVSVPARASRHGVMVSARGYRDAVAPAASAGGTVQVVLPFAPIPTRVRVQDQMGHPVAGATVTFHRDSGDVVQAVDPDGVADHDLQPGTWMVDVSAAGFGRQARRLDLRPLTRRAAVEVILVPAKGPAGLLLGVVGPGGDRVRGVRVRVDGHPVGALATGGTLELWGLGVGKHHLEVTAEGFQGLAQDTSLDAGPNVVRMTLTRVPGSVEVIARAPDGPVRDAVVRFDGPSRLPPLSLGVQGRRIIQVRPGKWSVLVLSPSYGLQRRTVVVPEDRTELTVVDVLLEPSEGGNADLVLHVTDPDGNPVAGAEILLDGVSYGKSASGGTVTLSGLSEGARTLVVKGAAYRPLKPIDLFLVSGAQERQVVLQWRPGTVRVRARGPEGEVKGAIARFSGPSKVPPLPLGEFGAATTRLAPGQWQVLVLSEQWGMQARDLIVPPDSGHVIDVDVVLGGLAAGDADLQVAVKGPDQRPVQGARVAVDGQEVGSTSTAGTVDLRAIATGPVKVTVTAPAYDPATVPVTLASGDQAVDVPLSFAPGAVRLVARGPEGPALDAMIRLDGPNARGPFQVDANGTRLVALALGRWQGLASSAQWGLDEERFDVAHEATRPTVVTFTFAPLDENAATVVLHVQNEDGRPIAGAKIQRGKTSIGTTAAGGVALLEGLSPGSGDLVVSAEGFKGSTVAAATLHPGRQERLVTLHEVPRTVRVAVTDRAGAPVHAKVRAEGPADLPPVETDAAGHATLFLRSGTWQVVVDGGELGTASSSVQVQPGIDPKPVDFTLSHSLVDVTDVAVLVRERVHFQFDRATLRPESTPVIDQVAATLLGHPEIGRVEVQGHTDATGDAAYNMDLSQRRAEAVVAALVARGVAPERLVARGYGFTRPIADDRTEEGRARNRRVEFQVIEHAAKGAAPEPEGP